MAWHGLLVADAVPRRHLQFLCLLSKSMQLKAVYVMKLDRRGVYVQGELSGEIHKVGIVESEEFSAEGSFMKARVPVPLAMRLAQFAVDPQRQPISA